MTLYESKSNLITQYNLGEDIGFLWWMPSFCIFFLFFSFFPRVLKCYMCWKVRVVEAECLWLVTAQGFLKCSEILQLRWAITLTKIFLKLTRILKIHTKLSAMNCEGDMSFSKPLITNIQILGSLAIENKQTNNNLNYYFSVFQNIKVILQELFHMKRWSKRIW